MTSTQLVVALAALATACADRGDTSVVVDSHATTIAEPDRPPRGDPAADESDSHLPAVASDPVDEPASGDRVAVSCERLSPRSALGARRDAVGCGRDELSQEGNCVVYSDGLTACYRGGTATRLRLVPCRVTSGEHWAVDLAAAGFDVSRASLVLDVDAARIEGVPGLWVEGQSNYCYINPSR